MAEAYDVNMYYGTPKEYFAKVLVGKPALPQYFGDFLPYGSYKKQIGKIFWTGLYSTRPQLKKELTFSLRLNRAANILSGIALKENYNSKNATYGLHHDAITGTCKAHVMQDYLSRATSAN